MADFQESNYWLTTATMPAGTGGELPSTVDVAVIGAGYTGLSAARTLAKRGAKVAVLEANTIGWGASSRNGGMVLTGMKLGCRDFVQALRDGADPPDVCGFPGLD